MIIGTIGDSRVPFQRPAAAGNARPSRFSTGFVSEFETFPTVMAPHMTRLPAGIDISRRSAPPVASVESVGPPAGIPAPVKMRGSRMLPPHLIMALGIMPGACGPRRATDPTALVTGGRKPGL